MKDTMFLPPASLHARIAPTESCTPYGWPCEGPDMKMLRGVVHDPTARRMGGVAGHAGLFGTAADLSIFCRMLLQAARYNGTRILSPLGVAEDDHARDARLGAQRPRPRLGHRLVVLGESRRAAADRIVRPHRFHRHVALDRSGDRPVRRLPLEPRPPDGKGDVTPLRARVATVAASALDVGRRRRAPAAVDRP